MIRVLVIHGAGIELRGKVDVATFGSLTMDDYDSEIARSSEEFAIEVEIFHSTDVAAVVSKLESCKSSHIDGVIINPAGFTVGHPVLAQALQKTGLPTVELHISNPANRAIVSGISPSVACAIAGFGIQGYSLAMQGIRDIILAAQSEMTASDSHLD